MLQIHAGAISAVVCSNHVIFTSSADGTIKVWRTDFTQVCFFLFRNECVSATHNTIHFGITYTCYIIKLKFNSSQYCFQIGQFFPTSPVTKMSVMSADGEIHLLCGDQLGNVYMLNWVNKDTFSFRRTKSPQNDE